MRRSVRRVEFATPLPEKLAIFGDGLERIPLIRNNEIGEPGDYQGNNGASGKASNQGLLSESDTLARIADRVATYTVHQGEAEAGARAVLDAIRGGETSVTVYRATSGTSINHGDWVFLSEGQADAWARSPFSGTRKRDYSVVAAQVGIKQVAWTGKNLEFQVL